MSPSSLIEILLMHNFPGAPLRGSSINTLTLFANLEPIDWPDPILSEIQGATSTVKTT